MKRRISTILISSGTIILILSMLLSTVSFAAGPARPLDDAQAMPPAQGEGNCLQCTDHKYEANDYPGLAEDGMCDTVPPGEVVTAVSIKTGLAGCVFQSIDGCYTIKIGTADGLATDHDWCATREGSGSGCQEISHIEVCTQADPCYNVTCDDGDLCTTDACNPNTGQCESTPVTCDDGDACTTDACDPATGQCASDPVVCQDDGLWCNGTPTCDPLTGECVPGTPPDCDDDNICTDDSCDEANDECDNVFDVTNDPSCEACYEVVCDDGLWCNGLETCDPTTGECLDGTPVDCSDQDICTDDSCDEANDECDNVFDVTNDPSCEAPTPTPTPTPPPPCANATIYVDVTQCNAPVAGLSVVLHSSAGDSHGPKMTPATFSVIGGTNRDWYAVIDGARMGGTIKVTECGGTGAIGAALDCPAPPVVEVLGVERLPVTGEMPLGPAFSTLPMILSSLSLIGSGLLLRRKE